MKTKLLLIVWTILSPALLWGQSDYQWLMLDAKGKSDYNESTNQNVFNNTFPDGKIKFEGVAHPILATNPAMQLAKNHIFAMYSDGSYFNSRDMSSPTYDASFFLPSSPSSETTHYFNSGSKTVSALYLTNVYEGDDPPKNVKAASYSSTSSTVYSLPTTTPGQMLTANHDVVMGKDITLIVKNTGQFVTGDTLLANKLIVGTGNIVYDTFFTRSPVFSNNSRFSNINVDDKGNGKFVLSGFTSDSPRYFFINLRSTDQIRPYIGSSFAAFMVRSSNPAAPYTHLTEAVLSSHDPNYVEVLETCTKKVSSDSMKFVKYHLEFENTGSLPGEKIKARVTLPQMFKKKCVTDVKFYLGGEEVDGDHHTFLRHLYFQYPDSLSVLPCVTDDASLCSGYIEFWIKVDPETDLTDPMVSLEFLNPKVTFGHQPYPIEIFEDLPFVDDPNSPDGMRQPPVTNCTCACP